MRKLTMILTGVAALAAPVCVWGGAPVKLWEKAIVTQILFRPQDGATVADLDRDSKEEVLVASTDGKLYVWRCDGTAYAGFPKGVHRADLWFQSTPAVGDIDGDGDMEIVIGARGKTSFVGGALYAWHHDGKTVKGFPKLDIYIYGTVALEDLDDDGANEIIACERGLGEGWVHVFYGTGKEAPGWPRSLHDVPGAEPSVGDIDDDGEFEIFGEGMTLSGTHVLWAWNEDGSTVRGFPFEFQDPLNEYMSDPAPALADWNKDGRLEIAFGTQPLPPVKSYFYLLGGDGKLLPGWPKEVGRIRGAASAADIDRDGYLEIVAQEYHYGDSGLFVWNHDGTVVPGFPISPYEGAGSPAVADIDGDKRLEIIVGLRNGGIVAVNHDGSICEGFPIITNRMTWFNSVAVQDINRDGALEMVTVSYVDATAYVGVYRLGGDPKSPVWPMHNHDRRHTSCYDTDLEIGIKLDHLCARAEGEAVLVSWATSGEWDHAGFNLYRGSADAAKAKLNAELITGRTPYRYLDRGVESGVEYKYWLEAVELSGTKETYGPVYCRAGGDAKASFALAQNAPNPARNGTTVAFSVPAACEATVAIYDIAGRKVAVPFAGAAVAGANEISVDVSGLAPGVYAYRLEAGGEAAARKMVVIK